MTEITTKPLSTDARLTAIERRLELLYQFARTGNRNWLTHHWKLATPAQAIIRASHRKADETRQAELDTELADREAQEQAAAEREPEIAQTREERVAAAAEGMQWCGHGQYRDRHGIVRDVGYDPAKNPDLP